MKNAVASDAVATPKAFMLSGATASAFAMAGTAVFRIVVSSDSMKKATATSHDNNRFTDSPGAAGGTETALEWAGIILPPADYLAAIRFQFRIAGSYLFNAETRRTQSIPTTDEHRVKPRGGHAAIRGWTRIY